MSGDLILLGGGGNAHDVLDIIDALHTAGDRWRVLGLLDDTRPTGAPYLGSTILGGLGDAASFDGVWFINTIRNEGVFRRAESIIGGLGVSEDRFATLVHPAASVSRRAELGTGVYVCYGASVAGGAALGAHASLGPGCTIGHDASVGNYSVLAAGAVIGGGVQVGRACYIGSGALVKQRLDIGDGALIGLGAVVVKNVAEGQVVVGNPSRPIARNQRSTAIK